jgi:hypothetical protein
MRCVEHLVSQMGYLSKCPLLSKQTWWSCLSIYPWSFAQSPGLTPFISLVSYLLWQTLFGHLGHSWGGKTLKILDLIQRLLKFLLVDGASEVMESIVLLCFSQTILLWTTLGFLKAWGIQGKYGGGATRWGLGQWAATASQPLTSLEASASRIGVPSNMIPMLEFCLFWIRLIVYSLPCPQKSNPSNQASFFLPSVLQMSSYMAYPKLQSGWTAYLGAMTSSSHVSTMKHGFMLMKADV